MTTARDLIKASLRKIQVLGVGASLSPEDAADALEALNAMIASWSVDGALIYTETKETFSLTSGTISYSIGASQTWNTVRPTKIKSGYVTYSGYDTPIRLIGKDDYAEIVDKDVSGVPCEFYYDAGYPAGNVYVYPVPLSNMSVTLFSEKPLTAFASLNTDFEMPPEYERAIVYNLAVEIAPEYEREAPISVKRIAKTSLQLVKTQNRFNDKSIVKAGSEWVGYGEFDINSGTYR